ncbi:hypothetical protein [Blastococcus sp. SYSU D01042]
MSVLARPEVQRLVGTPLVGGLLTGRLVAGPRAEDALRIAAGLAEEGCAAAFEHRPAPGADAAAELTALVDRVAAAGPPGDWELTLPVQRLADARGPAADAAAAGLGVALAGPAGWVDALLAGLPGARAVVEAGEPDAEARCRVLAGERVRLRPGRGAAARLAFVRCVDVLLAGSGSPAVATGDPRLIAITGERAAWHGRASDSWELVMPWGIRTSDRRRLVAAGNAVRVAVPSGPGALAVVAGGLR